MKKMASFTILECRKKGTMVNINANIVNRFIWFANVDRKYKNRINYNYFRQIRLF